MQRRVAASAPLWCSLMSVPNERRAARIVTALTDTSALTSTTSLAGAAVAVVALAALVVVSAAAKDSANTPVDLLGLLTRLGERVEAYYARAQSIMCLETVRVQRMNHDLTPEPHMRVLIYELHVQRDGATGADPVPEANVRRQLMTINGRVPKPNGDPDCLDPNETALDALSFLLPHHQGEYTFSYKGSGRLNGRAVAMIDYAPVSAAPAEATWRDGCVSVEAPAHVTGRIWIDAATGDVLRFDERMRGPIDLEIPRPQRLSESVVSMTFERADASIRFKAVAFTDPDETVLLPESIETLTVARGAFSSIRMTHTFTGYQRFVTGARIIQ